MEKQDEYAVKLQNQISEIFEQESENHINYKELEDSDNATAFFHALANIVPAIIYNNLTGEEHNLLEFNHVANKLVFQFTKLKQ